MGMFDTILVKCPNCGEKHEAQTKSGICCLQVYDMPGEGSNPAPIDALKDINRHAPFLCNCGVSFFVKEIKPPQIIPGEYESKIINDNQEFSLD